ncbi:hypothetical protein B0T13DRAFT_57591 [Neurospora crassa]|nr:hypothetical protein B0T13DRAFT_57591 [Neurospora crassa]
MLTKKSWLIFFGIVGGLVVSSWWCYYLTFSFQKFPQIWLPAVPVIQLTAHFQAHRKTSAALYRRLLRWLRCKEPNTLPLPCRRRIRTALSAAATCNLTRPSQPAARRKKDPFSLLSTSSSLSVAFIIVLSFSLWPLTFAIQTPKN